MRQIERWYDIEVVYQNGIPDIKFWGKITKDVPLSGILIALKKTKVHFKLDNNRTLNMFPAAGKSIQHQFTKAIVEAKKKY